MLPNFYVQDRKQPVGDVEGATGLKYDFDEWNPDYHKDEARQSDPTLKPDGLDLGDDEAAKPYKHYRIPGTKQPGDTSHRTGILDAPNFCDRAGAPLAPIERLLFRFLSGTEQEQTQIPGGPTRATLKVVVEARSYLVCLRDGRAHCIGYLEWTYTNEAQVVLEWADTGGVAAGSARKWKLGSRITRCDHTLEIEDWTSPC